MEEKKATRLDIKDALMFVGGGRLRYGGYQKNIVKQELSEMEEGLIVCSVCSGILRDACNINNGMTMACKTCTSEESCVQPVGRIRDMVLQIGCRCPLSHRGCNWEGAMGDISGHLNECEQVTVQCPYSIYGCSTNLARGDIEDHKLDSKEEHKELVSLSLGKRVDQLEEERKQHVKLLNKLDSLVECLQSEREYYKLNGIVWNITDRERIKAKFQEFDPNTLPNLQIIGTKRSHPQISHSIAICPQAGYRDSNQPVPRPLSDSFEIDAGLYSHPDSANSSFWEGNHYNGPHFGIEYLCHLYPRFFFENSDNLALYLVPKRLTDTKWSLQGTWKVTLISGNDSGANWQTEVKDKQVSSSEILKLTYIQSEVLLDESFNQNGTIRLKILFKRDK